ncbi:MAG: hypothetical protein QW545_07025 [Thermosphaera sp.]
MNMDRNSVQTPATIRENPVRQNPGEPRENPRVRGADPGDQPLINPMDPGPQRRQGKT